MRSIPILASLRWCRAIFTPRHFAKRGLIGVPACPMQRKRWKAEGRELNWT
jgi:hypothetical protein